MKRLCEVVSIRDNKTLSVMWKYKVLHRKYKKYISKITKLKVRLSENNSCKVGDFITIRPCRPYAKTVAWIY